MAFNRQAFIDSFNAAMDLLRESENVTKRELRALSRNLLDALHNGDDGAGGKELATKGDVTYINSLLNVLTPVNRKVAVLYFQHFTGFFFSKDKQAFQKKDNKRYSDCAKASAEFLADPHNNIWTWAEREIEIEAKPFDMLKVTKFIENALKKTGHDEIGVLRAVLAGGLKVGTIVAMMHELGIEASQKQEQEQQG